MVIFLSGCNAKDTNNLDSSEPEFAAATLLLTNPGFENDTQGWSNSGGFSITPDAHTGSKAAKVNATGGFSSLALIDTAPGEIYQLSAYAKTTGTPSYAGIGLHFLNTNNERIGQDQVSIDSANYAFVSKNITIPSNTVSAQLWGWVEGSGGITVDDIELKLVINEPPSSAVNYFVDANGDDSNSGLQGQPWQTLDRITTQDLGPGDVVHLTGGQTFTGTLELTSVDNGSSDFPVKIQSTGDEPAIINAGSGSAIVLDTVTDVLVENLVLVGAGRNNGNSADGMLINNSGNVSANHIEVSGFQHSGVFANNSNDISLTYIHAHDNGYAGIHGSSDGQGIGNRSQNLYIGYSKAVNNPGDPTVTNNHSGNGIVVGNVDNVTIEYCFAEENGWDMPRVGNGPVGIWIWQSDSSLLQYNIARRNRTPSGASDGGGFDFDGGVTNSIMQYNISYENDGAGYGLFQYAGASPWYNNIIRYNVSENDGSQNPGGISIWTANGAELMRDASIYNNVVYNTIGPALKYTDNSHRNFNFSNNIFFYNNNAIQGSLNSSESKLIGNLWYDAAGGSNIAGYDSLQSLAGATGQEMYNGDIVGVSGSPQFADAGASQITDPTLIPEYLKYRLSSNSPAVNAGVDVTSLFAQGTTSVDLYGNNARVGSAVDIGVHELPGAAGPTAGTLNILTLGDSITQSDGSHVGYRYYLWKNLIDYHYDFDLVGSETLPWLGNGQTAPAYPGYQGQAFDQDHEGHYAWTSKNIVEGHPDWGQPDGLSQWVGNYTADTALVHIGTNDIREHSSPPNAAQSASGALAYVENIIDTLQADNPDVTIFLAQIIPFASWVQSSSYDYVAYINNFNAGIPDVASRKSTARSDIVVVDHFTDFTDSMLRSDGVHPNDTGQRAMAQRWIDAMNDYYGIESDSDRDGVTDDEDAFPNDPSETTDTDGDGAGDNADAFPNNPNESRDLDSDGTGDNADLDRDGDGTSNSFDLYPDNSTRSTGIWRELFNGIAGRTVSGLINSPAFPDSPDLIEQLSSFEGPVNVSDYYGSRIHGIFYAPETGSYTFWVSGDDNIQLNLSSDNNPANKQQIASVPDWTNSREWNRFTEQKSASVDLVADQPYYLEVLHNEGHGGDNVAVAWQTPGDNTITILPDSAFIPSPVIDADSDGVPDNIDAFPNNPNESIDSDSDGMGDNADAFPNNASETSDTDGDGVGDNADAFPNDATRFENPGTGGGSPGAITNPLAGAITLDGDLTDWSSVTSFGIDAQDISGDNNPLDWQQAWLANDASHLYIAWLNYGNVTPSWGQTVYFDTDNNAASGFSAGLPIGADYVLQGQFLYRYSGEGNNWQWTFVAEAVGTYDGDTAEYRFNLSDIASPESLRLAFVGSNTAYTGGTAEDLYPDGIYSSDDDVRYFEYSFVTPANSAPAAINQFITAQPGVAKLATLTGSDSDGDQLSFEVITQPVNGTLSGTLPNISYTANAGFSGEDAFSFHVNDGQVFSAPATVQLSVAENITVAASNIASNLQTDGDLQDWADYTSFTTDANDIDGADNPIDWLTVTIAHDVRNFYFAKQFDSANVADIEPWGFNTFIDTDSDISSGYNAGSAIGADYLLQGDMLYQHTGLNGNDWQWNPVSGVTRRSASANTEISLDRAWLGDPAGFDVFFTGDNISLGGSAEDLYPDGAYDSTAGLRYFSYSTGGIAAQGDPLTVAAAQNGDAPVYSRDSVVSNPQSLSGGDKISVITTGTGAQSPLGLLILVLFATQFSASRIRVGS